MNKHQNHRTLYIALGSNSADFPSVSADILHCAKLQISKDIGNISKSSNVFKTPCFPAGAGPDFANAVIAVSTDMDLHSILANLHRIEADFGRERTRRWGQRTLDLDILADGEVIAPDLHTYQSWKDLPLDQQAKLAPSELILPHPRIQDRAFVLVPWREIAPEWRHPVLGRTVSELCASLPEKDRAEVVPIGGETAEK